MVGQRQESAARHYLRTGYRKPRNHQRGRTGGFSIVKFEVSAEAMAGFSN
jgi:hypothetical protein